jgi:acyl carrier protein
MDREAQVRAFLVDNFLFGKGESLASSDSLLSKGVIDSTGVLELIAFLEQTFGISIDDSDVQADNFDSIQRIVRYLDRKVEARDSKGASES